MVSMKPAVAASLMVALAACASPVGQAPTTSPLRPQDPGDQQAPGSPSASEEGADPQETMTSPSPLQEPGTEEGWSFLIQPYLLGVSIDGNASVGRLSGAEVEIDFSDILETLQLGGMIHAEGYHPSGWGGIVDYAFMDLEDDLSGPLGLVIANVKVFQGVFEALGAYRFETDLATVDAFAGIRWWDIDLDVDFSVGSAQGSRDFDWVDPVVGAKANWPIGDRWAWLVRGDVGGFGIESDFTWSASTGFRYQVSGLFSMELQYRALGVDYEEGTRGTPSYFAYDTITHGPQLGFGFHF